MPDKDPQSIFDIVPDEAREARLDAEAAYTAGRTVPHEKVAAWLKSWGTPDELPCPTPGQG